MGKMHQKVKNQNVTAQNLIQSLQSQLLSGGNNNISQTQLLNLSNQILNGGGVENSDLSPLLQNKMQPNSPFLQSLFPSGAAVNSGGSTAIQSGTSDPPIFTKDSNQLKNSYKLQSVPMPCSGGTTNQMPFGEQKDINHRKNPVKAFLQESLNRQHSRDQAQALKMREKSKDV